MNIDYLKNFPTELITCFLDLLPAKYLIRCLWVCPTWNRIIEKNKLLSRKIEVYHEEKEAIKQAKILALKLNPFVQTQVLLEIMSAEIDLFAFESAIETLKKAKASAPWIKDPINQVKAYLDIFKTEELKLKPALNEQSEEMENETLKSIIKIASENENVSEKEITFAAIVREVAHVDLGWATVIANQLIDSFKETQNLIKLELVKAEARTDPKAATEIAETIPNLTIRDQAFFQIVEIQALDDPKQAKIPARKIKDPFTRRTAFLVIFQREAKDSPEKAEETTKEIELHTGQVLLEKIKIKAKDNPNDAIRLAKTIKELRLKSEAYLEIAKVMPDKIAFLLNKAKMFALAMNDLLDQSNILSKIAKFEASFNAEAAEATASLIKSEELRAETLLTVLESNENRLETIEKAFNGFKTPFAQAKALLGIFRMKSSKPLQADNAHPPPSKRMKIEKEIDHASTCNTLEAAIHAALQVKEPSKQSLVFIEVIKSNFVFIRYTSINYLTAKMFTFYH